MPQIPPFVVGLKKLKMTLVETDALLLVVTVTAAGGCGNPVLAQKFCCDDQVRSSISTLLFVHYFLHIFINSLL